MLDVLQIFIYFSIINVSLGHKECMPRFFGKNGSVCVCTINYCDTIDPVQRIPHGQYYMYMSSKDGLRFNKTIRKFSSEKGIAQGYTINVDSTKEFQTIYGFGGAFTDAFGYNVNSLKGNAREYLMKSYFSDEGLEYSLCRVTIGGTDFSLRPYSYIDTKNDFNLHTFNLTYEDYTYKIPLIHEALSLRKGHLKLFATAWSAPAWTKTNNAYIGIGTIYEKYYQFWADYHLKFLEYYDRNNITFWGLTTGNQPLTAFASFFVITAMAWVPTLQAKWIAENLGPTIRNSKYKDIKIMLHDDLKFYLPITANLFGRNNKTMQYIDGFGVHWYYNTFIDGVIYYDVVHNLYPEKFILDTEAANGYIPGEEPMILGSWHRGEKYALDIIDDINHWSTGWVDWNMALDTNGGPNYLDNLVDSPIIVNSTANEFYKNPTYYALGHFSKFVPYGSKKIYLHVDTNAIKAVAFLRPDKGTVIVVLNQHSGFVRVRINDNKSGTINFIAEQHSITTFVYW